VISVKDLHKRFGSFRALRGIDLHVNKGEIYGFIGQNGAGKSTTMNILAGLSRPSGGECFVNGLSVSQIRHPSELHIGYLPENPEFYPWMTAQEMLHYLGNGPLHRASPARVSEVLGWVGLSSSAQRRIGGFSRGMKQRLGIGAALIHDPEVLILDEPSSALDPEGRSDVLQLIRELKQMGKTVFFSTHILSDVERVCDTVGMIVQGEMAMQGSLAEIQCTYLTPIYDIELQRPCPAAVVDRLRAIPGVTRVEASGDSLEISVTDTVETPRRLMRFLAEQEVAVQVFALRRRDLEQVFMQEVSGR